jgi:hypothetical protein
MRRLLLIGLILILAGCAAQKPTVTPATPTPPPLALPPATPTPPPLATATPQGMVDCRVHNVELAIAPRGSLATLSIFGGWWHEGFSTLAINVDGTLEFSQTTRTFLTGNPTRYITETVDSFSGVAPAADLQQLQSLIASPAFGAIKDCKQQDPAADGGASYLSVIDAQGEQTFGLSQIEMPAVLLEIWKIAHALRGSANSLQSTCVYTRVDIRAAPALQSCEQR